MLINFGTKVEIILLLSITLTTQGKAMQHRNHDSPEAFAKQYFTRSRFLDDKRGSDMVDR